MADAVPDPAQNTLPLHGVPRSSGSGRSSGQAAAVDRQDRLAVRVGSSHRDQVKQRAWDVLPEVVWIASELIVTSETGITTVDPEPARRDIERGRHVHPIREPAVRAVRAEWDGQRLFG